ncbi:MAG: haloacid dehalogenase type II [Actinobacteria bacterium]|nr:MAG: haloacid dehalogenase type II [Actinomycetota bacterium]
MRLVDFEALSFDCYGTLIDWEAGISAVLDPWAKQSGLKLSSEQLLLTYSGHEAAVEAEHGRWLYPQVLAEAMRRTGVELGVAVSDQEAEEFGGSVGQWPAFADSMAALQGLAGHYRLIILSNIDRASFAASNEKLGVIFDAIITAEDLGSYKPNPRNFTALIERAEEMEIPPGKLLHVAQSLFHDHVPAKEIGLLTVWINRRHGKPGWGATPDPGGTVTPDWEFTSMAAFAEAVRVAAAR